MKRLRTFLAYFLVPVLFAVSVGVISYFVGEDVNTVKWMGADIVVIKRPFVGMRVIYTIDGAVNSEQASAVIDYANHHHARELVINISSPGGRVFDAIEIANRITHSKVPVTTVTRSIAASAAFYVFISGHKRVIAKDSYLMHHSLAVPTGTTLTEAQLKFINKLQQKLNDYIKAIACGDDDEEAALFDIKFGSVHETWLDARQAKKLCLATDVEE
jgi:ATP-dependent protease ClpP protease subunit